LALRRRAAGPAAEQQALCGWRGPPVFITNLCQVITLTAGLLSDTHLEGPQRRGRRAVGLPSDHGEVAILWRASVSFAPYEGAPERAGVPFPTVAGPGFYDRPRVRDLLNALQALVNPTYDPALAGLLRWPVLALSGAAPCRLIQMWEENVAKLLGDAHVSGLAGVGQFLENVSYRLFTPQFRPLGREV